MRSYRLTYPTTLLRRPILNQLIKTYPLTVNILQAHITIEEGWLEVELSGEITAMNQAVEWLENEGIEVEAID